MLFLLQCWLVEGEIGVSSKAVLILAALLIPGTVWSRQDTSPLSAKALYYQSETDDDKPVAKSEPKQSQGTKTTPPKPVVKPSTQNQATIAPITKASTVGTPVSVVTDHLGLRYNLLQFDRKSGKSTAVDPEHVFEQGDCLQLEFSPNRSGYLYVFDQGTSGKWEVLLPSTLMSDENNVVKSREAIKVPQNYCFTVQNPAGTEHLFIVLSRNQEDMYSLNRAIRSRNQGPATNIASKTEKGNLSPVMEAENRLDAEIQRMRADLGSKDLGVEKIGESDQPGEPADAVYVVNTSNVSSNRLVTEILIRHR
jgi:hypothetical protein